MLLSARVATIVGGLAFGAGALFAATTVGTPPRAGTLPAAAPAVQTTASERRPPDSLIAAVESKKADVESNVVAPCKANKERKIAVERQREQNCAECSDQLAQLAIIEQQALARCDVDGLNERIADIEERKNALITQLEMLLKRFQQGAQSNAALCDEIRDGETEAEATFAEALVGQIMDGLMKQAPDDQIKLLEAAEGRLAEVRAPSRVTRDELGTVVAELKTELAGKSKAEARAIIVARIEHVKDLVAEVRVANAASIQIANHNLDRLIVAKPDVSGELLDAAYASFTTALQMVVDQGKSVPAIVKLNGVVGYGSDAVKISAVFGNLYQLEENVDGQSSLAAAAESQRQTAKSELDYLIKVRGELVKERDDAQHAAGR